MILLLQHIAKTVTCCPTPHQSFSALSRAKIDVGQSIRSFLTTFTVPYICLTLRCVLGLWPLTLNILVYHLWRGQTLYKIWAKSNSHWRSYCDFSIWPYDLEHVAHVALSSVIIFTKFKLSLPASS